MKWVVNNEGLFPGEVRLTPTCSNCGNQNLYIQEPGKMVRLNECPACNHKITWKSYLEAQKVQGEH